MYVGSSHAEPMLRNNVGEWNEKTMGAFNYISNRDSIYNYWKKRVKQTAKDNVIYTVGIRGVHDSKMEGAKTLSEKVSLLTQVLKDQRHLLAKYVNKDLPEIPQVFVPYKEVLPIYNAHLKVPDDVTLMWPDDNYGYIRRLSNPAEQQRSGSAGVYYHVSYWGSPMDYLWLTTTNPALIFEEMKKAWDLGATRMWIVNVGDLKPAEYDLQFFMDMAWNINSINAGNIQTHLENWMANTFGKKNAGAITRVMQAYYQLAYERRPAFLDWSSQIKNNKAPKVHPFNTAREIINRISQYKKIAEQAQEIKKDIPTRLQDAYYELVLYPVLSATYMNEKIMYAQRNKTLASYNLPAAEEYGTLAEDAYDSIVKITRYYNDSLANGKWKRIMSMVPRNRLVFNRPIIKSIKETNASGIMIWPEDSDTPSDASGTYILPNFNPYNRQQYFIELFNKGKENMHWRIVNQPNWLQLNNNNGSLNKSNMLESSINWNKIPKGTLKGSFTIKADTQSFNIQINIDPPLKNIDKKQVTHIGKHILINASQFTKSYNYSQKYTWTNIKGLGYSSNATMLYPIPPVKNIALSQSYLEYKFYTQQSGAATINICTVPTFPIYQKTDVSVGISLDNTAMLQKSFATKEKDNTWEDNVIRNQAFNIFNYPNLTKGWHTLRVYTLDPGVVLDQVRIDVD
ncbi:glycosyl hydrolase 115 family protein [Arachidicoccus sp.]|uniref:glycosyl hydrolase 115 family protein n=1 Tax=Arachidicoccus sp. TaxID=1872624 RepID=UPI003D1B1441